MRKTSNKKNGHIIKWILSILVIIFCFFYIFGEFAKPKGIKGLFDKNKAEHQKLIGTTTREFADSVRSNWLGTAPRPLRVIIWYPSDSGGVKEDIGESGNNVTILKDGNISSQSPKYPLILLSPGSGQDASKVSWLGSYLSLHGYITVSINHNGTAEEEKQDGPLTLSDFCIWERPQDVSAVLDALMTDTVFAERIDNSRIGAAGFSLGRATVIWAAGARLNLDSLQENSPPPPPQLVKQINKDIELLKTDTIVQKSYSRAGNLFKDKRIKAVFSLAPAVGAGFTKAGLSGVDVPVMIVVGDKDRIAPAETNAKRYARYLANSKLIILPGEAGHFSQGTSESEQKKILDHVSKLALDFFNEKLTP